MTFASFCKNSINCSGCSGSINLQAAWGLGNSYFFNSVIELRLQQVLTTLLVLYGPSLSLAWQLFLVLWQFLSEQLQQMVKEQLKFLFRHLYPRLITTWLFSMFRKETAETEGYSKKLSQHPSYCRTIVITGFYSTKNYIEKITFNHFCQLGCNKISIHGLCIYSNGIIGSNGQELCGSLVLIQSVPHVQWSPAGYYLPDYL